MGRKWGDLNLWNANDLSERFYTGKTRALHGTHLSTGDRMWSSFPHMRPMATITADTLDWYGFDEFGGSVHDVIGTRCDPYTANTLSGAQYHNCCHSNLSRTLAERTGRPIHAVEADVHDVLNVFMCTGFTADTQQYFMKSSPVRPGDYIEFFAEIDLLGALSACPGGDCSAEHSSDVAACHPLKIEIYQPTNDALAQANWQSPPRNGYDRDPRPVLTPFQALNGFVQRLQEAGPVRLGKRRWPAHVPATGARPIAFGSHRRPQVGHNPACGDGIADAGVSERLSRMGQHGRANVQTALGQQDVSGNHDAGRRRMFRDPIISGVKTVTDDLQLNQTTARKAKVAV